MTTDDRSGFALRSGTRLGNRTVVATSSVLVGLLLWEVGGRALPNRILVPFSSVVLAWIGMFLSGDLVAATLVSLRHMVLGFVLAVLVGLPLGFGMGRRKPLYWAFDPPLSAIYATPVAAIIPLVVVWFGLGLAGKTFIVFLMAFIELTVNVYQGLFEIPESYLDVSTSFGASKPKEYWSVLLPASAPFVLTGLRLAIGRSVRGMITAEIFLAAKGLGGLLISAGASFDLSIQLAIIITLTMLGVVAQAGLGIANRRFVHWEGEVR